ncbi:PH domain-containing protein [Liquorilactobacillus nagelii]|uniref:PH domain-containing protein n=1 Tax=Liquorilactobacillus nagelii TaxID=82688 RepID=UPI00242F1093|nr:PH domain-containing protein [Liquorilactobacillus nagelii]MCI1700595.1 PH domain-containing protein [Liquorilactobacillus nagelii]
MNISDYPLLTCQLPQKIKKVWLAQAIISFLLSVLILLVLYWVPLAGMILAVIFLLMLVSEIILIPYRYAFDRFQINSSELALQEGFFFRKTTFVPIIRIQHVEMHQGPLMRTQHLASLIIHTAATTHEIHGLTLNDASRFREQIIELVQAVKEDV